MDGQRAGGGSAMTAPPRPVAVLWDIENCPPPSSSSIESISFNLRTLLRSKASLDGPISMFSAYGDFTRFPDKTRTCTQKAGVNLVNISRSKHGVAHKAILVDMFVFAFDNPPPCSILLISDDVDFAPALHKLERHGCNMLLVTSSVSSVLSRACAFVWPWLSVVRGDFIPIPRSRFVYKRPDTPPQGRENYDRNMQTDERRMQTDVTARMPPTGAEIVCKDPSVPSSGFDMSKIKDPKDSACISGSDTIRKSSVMPSSFENHKEAIQRDLSYAECVSRGISRADGVYKDPLVPSSGFDTRKIKVPRDGACGSDSLCKNSVIPAWRRKETIQRHLTSADKVPRAIPGADNVRRDPVVSSSGFDNNKINLPKDGACVSGSDIICKNSMVPFCNFEKHKEVVQGDLPSADKILKGIPGADDVCKDPLLPLNAMEISKTKVPTDMNFVFGSDNNCKSSVMPLCNAENSKNLTCADDGAPRAFLGVDGVLKDPSMSSSGFDISKIKVHRDGACISGTDSICKSSMMSFSNFEKHREDLQRDLSDTVHKGILQADYVSNDSLVPPNGSEINQNKVPIDISCGFRSNSICKSSKMPCNFEKREDVLERVLQDTTKADDTCIDPLVPSSVFNVEEHKEILYRDLPVVDRTFRGISGTDDICKDALVPSSGFDISEIKVPREEDSSVSGIDRISNGAVTPFSDFEKHEEIVHRDMSVADRAFGGISGVYNVCKDPSVPSDRFDISKFKVARDVACATESDGIYKDSVMSLCGFEKCNKIILRDTSVSERVLQSVPGGDNNKDAFVFSSGLENLPKNVCYSYGGNGICESPMVPFSDLEKHKEVVQRELSVTDRAFQADRGFQANVDEDMALIPRTVSAYENLMVPSSSNANSTSSLSKEKNEDKSSRIRKIDDIDIIWEKLDEPSIKRMERIEEPNVPAVKKKDVVIISGFCKRWLYMKMNRMTAGSLKRRKGSKEKKRSVKRVHP